jgi:hypothetical protein
MTFMKSDYFQSVNDEHTYFLRLSFCATAISRSTGFHRDVKSTWKLVTCSILLLHVDFTISRSIGVDGDVW